MQKNIITMLIGSQAHSSFRKENILDKIIAKYPKVSGIDSSFLHLIESKKKLSNSDSNILNQLLTYGLTSSVKSNLDDALIITPRIGTISPWSSRATDIALHCNVDIVRIERCTVYWLQTEKVLSENEKIAIGNILRDQMTESLFLNKQSIEQLFAQQKPKELLKIDFLGKGTKAIEEFSVKNGLALSQDEITYLSNHYKKTKKNPTDSELMMFAQANSEHCRHKIFNAHWTIDNKSQEQSLFGMIRNTHKISPKKTIVAYSDNSSIIEGRKIHRFYPDANDQYFPHEEICHYLMKVETHNHPTAISPFSGSATGAGGEIRDEGATGRGSKPKAGLAGFSVSNLRIPNFEHSWEKNTLGKPDRIASALEIMIDGPIGAASYNNEFGRPNILGYFRTLEVEVDGEFKGFHKPIMLAGGIGNISDIHTNKKLLQEGNLLIQIGGPAMLIGLGGGAASSMKTGSNQENLDFDSVQRGNPELQRRVQEVIDKCWQMGNFNPILSIHDVGAGGLSNAFPELIHDGGVGAIFQLRSIHNEDLGMSPKEIWSNEAQERYVLAIDKSNLETFDKICKRERCPFAIVGKATKDQRLVVEDSLFKNHPVDMNLNILLGKPPKTSKKISSKITKILNKKSVPTNLNTELKKVLHYPAVGSKNFLITIGDRSVTGLIARDQMVGPWQIPVSNVAVTKSDFESTLGESFALGERSPVAITNAPASARLAIGEAITNIAASQIDNINYIKLSANWMAASGDDINDFALFESVKTVGLDVCPKLGISIPVGKDSMSMQTKWNDGVDKKISSPMSLVVSAFSECSDVSKTLTPQMQKNEQSTLLFIDLALGKRRMGGSCINMINNIIGGDTPDLEDPKILKDFFSVIQSLNRDNKIMSYHDRSDGGLITSLVEMCFAGRCGINIDLEEQSSDEIASYLFNEELGAVIQVADNDLNQVLKKIEDKLGGYVKQIGKPAINQKISIKNNNNIVFSETRSKLQSYWTETSFRMQSLRDNPQSALEEFNTISDNDDPGISPIIKFDIEKSINIKKTRAKIAILREQGVNGHNEMAAAFYYAGFEPHDIHMSDIASGYKNLDDYQALAACGGFSFGDVLGAGQGWAKSILFNQKVKDQFHKFFHNENTLTLGVCNGCQMLSSIKEIIPGTDFWPKFIKNESEQFEARFLSVSIEKTNSPFFEEMEGSILPVVVSHGEGRVCFEDNNHLNKALSSNCISLKYVNNHNDGTLTYPFNPNGSVHGITGLNSSDGRVSIMMPHPERVFRADQNSWHPKNWNDFGPWYRMFANANKYFA